MPARYFLAISAQTGLNWFLLILQAAKLSTKKKSYCYGFQDFWVENFFGLALDNGCLATSHQFWNITQRSEITQMVYF